MNAVNPFRLDDDFGIVNSTSSSAMHQNRESKYFL